MNNLKNNLYYKNLLIYYYQKKSLNLTIYFKIGYCIFIFHLFILLNFSNIFYTEPMELTTENFLEIMEALEFYYERDDGYDHPVFYSDEMNIVYYAYYWTMQEVLPDFKTFRLYDTEWCGAGVVGARVTKDSMSNPVAYYYFANCYCMFRTPARYMKYIFTNVREFNHFLNELYHYYCVRYETYFTLKYIRNFNHLIKFFKPEYFETRPILAYIAVYVYNPKSESYYGYDILIFGGYFLVYDYSWQLPYVDLEVLYQVRRFLEHFKDFYNILVSRIEIDDLLHLNNLVIYYKELFAWRENMSYEERVRRYGTTQEERQLFRSLMYSIEHVTKSDFITEWENSEIWFSDAFRVASVYHYGVEEEINYDESKPSAELVWV